MKRKLTKKTKRAIFLYIVILLLLFTIVEVLPKVTDIFETTQVLEPGTLTLSYETKGYFVKTEEIGVAADSGEIEYPVTEGTVVKKGAEVVSVKADSSKDSESTRFSDCMDRLKGYDGLVDSCSASISGVFSLSIDGYENYLTPEKMEKVKRETVESQSYRTTDLKRSSVIKGEPIFKISGDDVWYILCWIDKENVRNYQEGNEVTLQLPDGDVDATVYKAKKDGDEYRVIFFLDVYYKSFAASREEDMKVVASDSSGLIVSNKAIVEKNGKKGVYVKNKNGNYIFKQIKVIATDGKDSVLSDAAFTDENGKQITTVNVYDEVLRHPGNALEEDLKKEANKEKNTKNTEESTEQKEAN
jgi:putative membrane fusion protein